MPSSQTKGTIKTQKTKDKAITGNKETQMTGKHEPLRNLSYSISFYKFVLHILNGKLTVNYTF